MRRSLQDRAAGPRGGRADGGTGLETPWTLAKRCEEECSRPGEPSFALLIVEPEHGASRTIDLLLTDWLVRGLRQADVVANIGGDRYAVLLPEAGAYDAGRVADRIRREVPDVEVGAAVYPQNGVNLGELVAAAQRTMNGRLRRSA